MVVDPQADYPVSYDGQFVTVRPDADPRDVELLMSAIGSERSQAF